MTTKDYFLSKITNPQDLDLDGAYDAFCAVISDGDIPADLEDIFWDMPLNEQLADKFLMEVVPHLDIRPADAETGDFYEAARLCGVLIG